LHEELVAAEETDVAARAARIAEIRRRTLSRPLAAER
jgi:hypothetical protein